MQNIAAYQPILIDAQTGKDFFTASQNQQLYLLANAIAQTSGIPIAHETHRNKALFAAHIAHQLLLDNETVRITADFSHWCNVSESLLEQQEAALQLAVSRAVHIHARVGHMQGPQVSDPRLPHWQLELNAHLNWWDAIVANHIAHGAARLTITPEFGPIPYMQTHPQNQLPVANQWDINLHMMRMLKNRYSQLLK